MKSLRTGLVPTLALALAACADVQPIAPRAPTAGITEALKGATKVEVCHHSEETNSYILISIAPAALPAHLAHGDGQPGDPVPGQFGMRFGPDCTLLFVGGVLDPAAIGYIVHAFRFEGSITSVVVPPPPIIQVFRSVLIPESEARGILEFRIANVPGPVAHAELTLPFVGQIGVPPLVGIGLFAYAGDGVVTLSDFASGVLVSVYHPLPVNPPPADGSITFDVTQALNSLIAAHATYAGFNLRIGLGVGSAEGTVTFSAGFSDVIPHPTLTISGP